MGYSVFPAPSGAKEPRQQVFTSSGTWTKPSGVRTAEVTVVGAGGSNNSAGGGAGGVTTQIVDVSSISSVPITVGRSLTSFVNRANATSGVTYGPLSTRFGNFLVAHNGHTGTTPTSGASGGYFIRDSHAYPNTQLYSTLSNSSRMSLAVYGQQPVLWQGIPVIGHNNGNTSTIYFKYYGPLEPWNNFSGPISATSISFISNGNRLILIPYDSSITNVYYSDGPLAENNTPWTTASFGSALSGAGGVWTGTEFIIANKINSGNGLEIKASTDGVTWTTRFSTTTGYSNHQFQFIRYHSNGTLTLPSSSQISFSTDNGATWTTVNRPSGSQVYNEIVFYNGVWLTVSDSTSTYYTTTSLSGTWTTRTHSLTNLRFVARSNSGIMVGNTTGNQLWLTTDGVLWSSVDTFGAMSNFGNVCVGTSLDGYMFITSQSTSVNTAGTFPDGAFNVFAPVGSNTASGPGAGGFSVVSSAGYIVPGPGINGYAGGNAGLTSTGPGFPATRYGLRTNSGLCIVRWWE